MAHVSIFSQLASTNSMVFNNISYYTVYLTWFSRVSFLHVSPIQWQQQICLNKARLDDWMTIAIHFPFASHALKLVATPIISTNTYDDLVLTELHYCFMARYTSSRL